MDAEIRDYRADDLPCGHPHVAGDRMDRPRQRTAGGGARPVPPARHARGSAWSPATRSASCTARPGTHPVRPRGPAALRHHRGDDQPDRAEPRARLPDDGGGHRRGATRRCRRRRPRHVRAGVLRPLRDGHPRLRRPPVVRPGQAARRPAAASARCASPATTGRRSQLSWPVALRRHGSVNLDPPEVFQVELTWVEDPYLGFGFRCGRRSAHGVHRRHERRRARAVQGRAARVRGRRRPPRPARSAAVALGAAAPGADGRAGRDPAPGPHRPAHPGRRARRPRPPGVAHGDGLVPAPDPRPPGVRRGAGLARRRGALRPRAHRPAQRGRRRLAGLAATTRSRSVRRRPSSRGTAAACPCCGRASARSPGCGSGCDRPPASPSPTTSPVRPSSSTRSTGRSCCRRRCRSCRSDAATR